MEDDYTGAQSWEWDIQTTAGGGRFQLPGEMFEVCIWCVTEEFEQIVVQTVGMGSVNDHIRDSQDFEEQTRSLTLIGPWLQDIKT